MPGLRGGLVGNKRKAAEGEHHPEGSSYNSGENYCPNSPSKKAGKKAVKKARMLSFNRGAPGLGAEAAFPASPERGGASSWSVGSAVFAGARFAFRNLDDSGASRLDAPSLFPSAPPAFKLTSAGQKKAAEPKEKDWANMPSTKETIIALYKEIISLKTRNAVFGVFSHFVGLKNKEKNDVEFYLSNPELFQKINNVLKKYEESVYPNLPADVDLDGFGSKLINLFRCLSSHLRAFEKDNKIEINPVQTFYATGLLFSSVAVDDKGPQSTIISSAAL